MSYTGRWGSAVRVSQYFCAVAMKVVVACWAVCLAVVASQPAMALGGGDVFFSFSTGDDATRTQDLFIDSNNCVGSGPRFSYVGGTVTNISGGTLTGVTATLSGLVNHSLGGGQPNLMTVGTVAVGETVGVYFYIGYGCTDATSDALTITLADDTAGTVAEGFTATTRSAISSNAGGNIITVITPPNAMVGDIVRFTITYEFGNTMAGDEFYIQPSSNTGFDAACLRLLDAKIITSDIPTAVPVGATDQLYFVAPVSDNGSKQHIVVAYDFSAECVTSTSAAPFAGQTSGATNIKYTGNLPFFVDITITENPGLTLVKSTTTTDYAAIGDTIDYSYLVTNTGDVILAGPVTIADNKTTATCPAVSTVGNGDGNFDPGESVTCTAVNYEVTQSDLDAGSVTNTATASADGTDSNEGSVTVNATQAPALTLVKSTTTTSYSAVGDTIDYSYFVTNSGNVFLAGPVTIADDKTTATCPAVSAVGNGDGNLDPGESVTCTATNYVVVQGDLDTGSVTNIATASADGTDSNQDQVTVNALQAPALTLVKSTTTTSYAAVGDTIDYTYLVTNSGNVFLAGPVTIADDKTTALCPAVSTVGNGDGNLDPGESITCTATNYVVIQGDLDAGSVTNTATASASGTGSNQDQVTVNALQAPALSLVKSTTTTSYAAVGDTIDYSYLVTNSGNVFLAGPVTIADDKTTATCPAVSAVGNNDGNLDPGESVVCTATNYVVTQDDIDAGSVTNTATASASGTASNQDQVTVNALQAPALSLVKSTTTTSYAAVGDTIDYSYLVTNSGNVFLAGPVTIADDKTTATCPAVSAVGNNDGNLDPGESVVCTAINYVVTQDDIDAGSVTNTATASADGTDSNQDQVTVNASQTPALTLIKSTTTINFASVDDTIDYSYLVTNSGNVFLAGPVTIADDKTTVTCPAVSTVGDGDGNLDPGESITCSAIDYIVIQGDLDAGSVTNTATASADGTGSNQDQVTVNAAQSFALTLVKSTITTDYAAVGDTIDYAYLVTNSGNVFLTGPVTITDDKTTATCPAVSTVGDGDGNLDPGESITCTAVNYVVTQDDIDAGSVTNTATASASTTDSNQDQVTVNAIQSPALTLVKSTTTNSFSSVGDTIDYSYFVTNAGNVSLAGPVTIADDKTTATCWAVSIVGDGDGNLDPGESVTCTAINYVVIQADINVGSVTNTATASADGAESNQDQVTVSATQNPALTLAKSTTTLSYSSLSDTIDYSYLVTNSGNVSLAGPVTITDNKTTAACPAVSTVGNGDGNLDPGESITCTAVNYEVTQADLDAGSVTNTAAASADGTNSNPDQVTVNASQTLALTLVKSTTTSDFASVADTIDYSYFVTNSGNVSLAGPVTIADDKTSATCPAVSAQGDGDGNLDPGESVVCTATNYVVTQDDIDAGSVTNTATASASGTDSNQDQVTVNAVQSPVLTLVKSTTTNSFSSVGDTIDYSYFVTNAGNVSLAGPVTIADDKTTATCPAVSTVGDGDDNLDPGESITCTAVDYVVIQGDITAGFVINTATASAEGVQSNTDSARVDAVFGVDATVEITPLSTPGDLLIVWLTDGGLDTDPSVVETFSVEVMHDLTGEVETVLLTETGPNTGIFSGTIGTIYGTVAGNNNDGTFNTQAGDTLTVTYFDALTSNGGTATLTDEDVVEQPEWSTAVFIAKVTPKRDVVIGELVPYRVTVTNTSGIPLTGGQIIDLLPPGFNLVSGSSIVNGTSQAPTQSPGQLAWEEVTLAPGEVLTVTFNFVVGAGVTEGVYVNRAFVADSEGQQLTPYARASVRVVPSHIFDCADVIGKVFIDGNENGYHDQGEAGVPNVRLISVEGIEARTDAHGRYHIACAMIPEERIGQNYILKLVVESLPRNFKVTTENPRVIRLTRGKVSKLNFGVIAPSEVILALSDTLFVVGSTDLTQEGEKRVTDILTVLDRRRSKLRILYPTTSLDRELKFARMKDLRGKIRTKWANKDRSYDLAIESEVVFVDANRKEGEK